MDAGQHCPNTKKRQSKGLQQLEGGTLLSVPSKVFCKVVMMRITEAVDEILRKEQGLDQGEEPLKTYLRFGTFWNSAMSGRGRSM